VLVGKLNLHVRKYNIIKLESFLAALIMLNFYPWPIWIISVETVRFISFGLFLVSIIGFKRNKINHVNFVYLFVILYFSFGGLQGYILPNHAHFTLLFSLVYISKDTLILTLYKFEKILTFILTIGIIGYFVNILFQLPSFPIPPLNIGKSAFYSCKLFFVQHPDYDGVYEINQFMSVFDEPGALGTILALLISYRRLDLRRYRDKVYIIAGLISFSMAFYAILVVNLILNFRKSRATLFLILSFFIIFQEVAPEVLELKIFNRLDFTSATVIKDNRSTEFFVDRYDKFISDGGSAVVWGKGPSAITELSKIGDLNTSSYKSEVYRYGFFGIFLFLSFYAFLIFYHSNHIRSWQLFAMVLLIFWQRPYFNFAPFILLFLASIYYIDSEFKKVKSMNK